MTDTVKKEMRLRLQSSWGSFVLVPGDTPTNEWLSHNIGDSTEKSRRDYARAEWTLGPGHQLEKILSLFMSEGGVIG